MIYKEFEKIMSKPRMDRYLNACSGDSKKAMTLYRTNLNLSQQMFTIISCFEISLRNKIDGHYSSKFGSDWLRDSIQSGGFFNSHPTKRTKKTINFALNKLNSNYSHNKLIAEMDFGFWRYLFAKPQFNAGGKTLLKVFPAKPKSSPTIQYNQSFVFTELKKINDIRNRIAHHEAICFRLGHPIINTTYVSQHYSLILNLFNWMSIDEKGLLYGIDKVGTSINKINSL